MKRLGFISNLVHHLKRKLGWCPEPPNLKDKMKEGFLTAEESLFFEKPFPWHVLLFPIAPWLIAFQIWYVVTQWPEFHNPSSFILLVIFILWPIVHSIPFISKRKILLTSKELHLQLAISEDVIKTKDIKSIEYLGRKRPQLRFSVKGKNSTGLEALFNWGGYNGPPFLGVRYTKNEEKETKWYFFSGERYYFKINRQNGTAICFSVNNPQLFANKLKKIMPSIASNLIKEIEQVVEKEVISEESKELYERLLHADVSIYGGGKQHLDLVIESNVEQGLSRDEAIHKLAEKERLFETG